VRIESEDGDGRRRLSSGFVIQGKRGGKLLLNNRARAGEMRMGSPATTFDECLPIITFSIRGKSKEPRG